MRSLVYFATSLPGYLKAAWPDFWGCVFKVWPAKTFKSVGGEAPHIYERPPKPRGPARPQERTQNKSGQTAIRYPACRDRTKSPSTSKQQQCAWSCATRRPQQVGSHLGEVITRRYKDMPVEGKVSKIFEVSLRSRTASRGGPGPQTYLKSFRNLPLIPA
jgi:hypothetical protein